MQIEFSMGNVTFNLYLKLGNVLNYNAESLTSRCIYLRSKNEVFYYMLIFE